MDKLQIAKVERVLLQRINANATSSTAPSTTTQSHFGTLHLTQHHIIFSFDSPSAAQDSGHFSAGAAGNGLARDANELWIPFSLILLCQRLPSIIPSNATSRSPYARIYPLLLRLKNFETFALGFGPECVTGTGSAEVKSTEVWESIKDTIVVSSPSSLFAFYYSPDPPLQGASSKGWGIYNVEKELARQGLGTRTKGWRMTDVNAGYGFCPTYPAQLCVPSRITDATLRYASKYRSKARIPALTYLHWANLGSISRCSQPMVGINNRSAQDEKLIEAIFTSHLFADPTSPTAKAAEAAASLAGSPNGANPASVAMVYGATPTNLIVDARPTTNAMANRAKGAGTENMDHYKGCKKAFLGVDNIHVMRDSLGRVSDALRDAESPVTFGAIEGADGSVRSVSGAASPLIDTSQLKRSGWLKHISALLEGTLLIVRNVHINSSHVLIHCSDGWDRTSQLSALAQLCLDPYFRTLEGFATLVEKDFVSFGFRFWDRCGHASSPKYFTTARGYGEDSDDGGRDERYGADGGDDEPLAQTGLEAHGQAAANAFWGFTKQIANSFQSSGGHGQGGAHLKEISPVFHQFLDCVWQLLRQFPERFEFNDEMLVELHTQLHECRFGNFLNNCERERRVSEDGSPTVVSRTHSAWDWLLAPGQRERWLNPSYDAKLDDAKREGADMGVLLPNAKELRYFAKLFRRGAVEMNAGVVAEEEERRRALEAAAKARAAQAKRAAEAARLLEENRDVGNVTVGPLVGSAAEDPVLNGRALLPGSADGAAATGASSSTSGSSTPQPEQQREGIVDLATRTDGGAASGQALAYKPRVPRTNLAARQSQQGAGQPGGSTMAPQLSNGAYQAADGSFGPARSSQSYSQPTAQDPLATAATAAPQRSQAAAHEQQPLPQDLADPIGPAAAKMKNLFVSGWGRLQAVYNDATAAAAESGATKSQGITPLGEPVGNVWAEEPTKVDRPESALSSQKALKAQSREAPTTLGQAGASPSAPAASSTPKPPTAHPHPPQQPQHATWPGSTSTPTPTNNPWALKSAAAGVGAGGGEDALGGLGTGRGGAGGGTDDAGRGVGSGLGTKVAVPKETREEKPTTTAEDDFDPLGASKW